MVIGVVGSFLLIVTGSIPCLVRATVSAWVTPIVVQDLLAVIEMILKVYSAGLVVFSASIPNLMCAVAVPLVIAEPGRFSVVRAMLSCKGVAPAVFAVISRMGARHRRPAGHHLGQVVLIVVADHPLTAFVAIPSMMCETRLVLGRIIPAFVDLALSVPRVLQGRGR